MTTSPPSAPFLSAEGVPTNAVCNDKYLYQRALTRDWLAVYKFCKMLLDSHEGASSLKEKNNELLIRGIARRQLLQYDPWDNHILHLACYDKPQVAWIRSILQLAELVGLDLLTQTNDRHATPILVACSNGASIEVLTELVRPTYRGAITAIRMTNDEELTVFDGLLGQYRMWRRVPALRETNPAVEDIQQDPMEDSIKDDSRLIRNLWKSVQLLLCALWQDNDSHVELRKFVPSLSHAAAHASDLVPPVLLDAILRVDGQESRARASKRSKHFAHPVHLALLGCNGNPQNNARREHCIRRLLELEPSSANQTLLGSKRSCFLQAIVSGFSWSSMTSADAKGPLCLLYETGHAEPNVFEERDSLTGLLAFQLAATVDSTSQVDATSCPLGLDTIYHLLREHPQVLMESGAFER